MFVKQTRHFRTTAAPLRHVGNEYEKMTDLSEKEYLLQFISLLRDLPQLWKLKSKEYMDKHKRELALKKMVQLLKISRPQTTEEDVKKKINILRTTFNRENNKIKKSRLSGSSTDDLYVPTLWYFKELQFLEDQGEPVSGISTESEESSVQPGSATQSDILTGTSTQSGTPAQPDTSQSISLPASKKKRGNNLQNELMLLAKQHFKTPESEFQIMAKNWAFKLQRMPREQQRLAEKFINDILFEGECGNLNRNSVMINASPASPRCSFNSSPIPLTPSPNPYISTTINHTQPLVRQSPSSTLHIQSTIPQTKQYILHSPSPIPDTLSSFVQQPNQSYSLSIPSPMLNVPDEIVETTENTTEDVIITSDTETDTAASFLQSFYAL